MRPGDHHVYFFYGTLIDADVRAAVLGRAAAGLNAVEDTLPGWRTVFMSGKTYPVVVPSPGRAAAGVRVAIPGARARRRLTRFEGPEYRMTSLALASGEEADVFIGSKLSRPGTRGWDFDAWNRRDKARFLARIRSVGRA